MLGWAAPLHKSCPRAGPELMLSRLHPRVDRPPTLQRETHLPLNALLASQGGTCPCTALTLLLSCMAALRLASAELSRCWAPRTAAPGATMSGARVGSVGGAEPVSHQGTHAWGMAQGVLE